MTDRRTFLASSAALLAAACTKPPAPFPSGELTSTNHTLGHKFRDGGLPTATEKRRAKVVIVGAGISGLSAAWCFKRAGFNDFELLELEAHPGGNSRWGENTVSAYPLGAHYIPLPTKEGRSTRLMLADLGVLQGDPDVSQPRYDERALCQAPQERLFRNGSWVEGLAPLDGRSAADTAEWQRFAARMRGFQDRRGKDGRRAFAIPLEFSSRDADFLMLDRITMEAWMRAEGFHSEAVHWLVDYACRDDYGSDYRRVSAWAGIHYFACRSAFAQNADADTVLTWPEGNGYIVKQLLAKYRFPITQGALVHRVEESAKGITLVAYLAGEQRSVEIQAERVVWAAPFAFAARALTNAAPELVGALRGRDYAPWVVANLTLSEPPYAHHGAPLAWDNVIYDSASLGYVVSTHQGVATRPGPTVLSWYLPLAADQPAEGRKRLLAMSRERWAQVALTDIAKPHPEIQSITTRVDVFANGHAMVVPQPGLIWGADQRRVLAHKGHLHFAHADASGLSLFEEANDRGVAAAEAVLAALGSKAPSLRYRV